MPMRFLLVFDLPRNHPADYVPTGWPVVLRGLGEMWVKGESTELITLFVEYFKEAGPDAHP